MGYQSLICKLKAKLPDKVLGFLIGHADSETTRNIYLHVTQAAKSKWDDTIFSL